MSNDRRAELLQKLGNYQLLAALPRVQERIVTAERQRPMLEQARTEAWNNASPTFTGIPLERVCAVAAAISRFNRLQAGWANPTQLAVVTNAAELPAFARQAVAQASALPYREGFYVALPHRANWHDGEAFNAIRRFSTRHRQLREMLMEEMVLSMITGTQDRLGEAEERIRFCAWDQLEDQCVQQGSEMIIAHLADDPIEELIRLTPSRVNVAISTITRALIDDLGNTTHQGWATVDALIAAVGETAIANERGYGIA